MGKAKKCNMLINRYKTIFKNDEEWKYYSHLHFHESPFENKDVSDRFITEYFKTGNKKNVLDTKFPKDADRDIHSISTFFLGILLKSFCRIPELKPDFRYLWFITCLYHDYGYYIEKEKVKYPPKKTSIKSIAQKLNVQYNLLESDYFSKERRDMVITYYDFGRQEYHFLNHGIIGGLMLYDKLKKNYSENKEKAKKDGIYVEKDDFIYNGLHWSTEHDEFYKETADSIISHNIWYAYTKKDKILYESYYLDDLIIQNKNQRISISSNPFLFLLLLADTIEPIKFFNQISYNCLLEKIDIEIVIGNKILITVYDNCLNYKDWFFKIKDLENWLSLTISDYEEKKLIIEIE